MTNHPLCAVDGRPVHDDRGRLCPACWADLDHDLTELIDSLARDLELTLAGLGRSGGSPIGIVVRSAAHGIGYDENAGDIARDLRQCLGGWVRVVIDDSPDQLSWPADNLPDLARWLIRHRRHVREHEAVADLWHEIRGHIANASRAIDRRPDKRYLGVCSAALNTDVTFEAGPLDRIIERCDADLYAIDGHATTTCRHCGATHDTAERRAVLLGVVDDQLGTAAEIARALAAYGDVELKVERVRQWYSRGQIAQHAPRDGDRWPRYRVGDVRELLNPTRTVKAG